MKIFLKIIAVLILIIIGVIYYLYHQVSYTPEWYDTINTSHLKNIISKSDSVDSHIKSKLQTGMPVKVNSNELSSIIVSNIKKQVPDTPEQVIKGIKTNITPEKITIEAVLNLRNISMSYLDTDIRESFIKFLDTVPNDVIENFYIKFEGVPINNNGQIKLDQQSYIQLGKMKYTIDDVSKIYIDERTKDKYGSIAEYPFTDFILNEEYLTIIP